MPENTHPGELVARLQITGSAAEISTRLIYNSSDVKTNGTDYFTLNFTDLFLRSSEFYRRFPPPGGNVRFTLPSLGLRLVDIERISESVSFHRRMHGAGRSVGSRHRFSIGSDRCE